MILIEMRRTGSSPAEMRRRACHAEVILAAMILAGPAFAAGQITASKASAPQQKAAARAHGRAATVKTQPVPPTQQSVSPQPYAPKPPAWPVNDHAAPATVVWNSQGLRIDAANASLQETLNEIAIATGTKITGSTADQRIFGTYGPGTARDVLLQLLDGSGYNVLMIGDQGQGTPRQVLLSRRPTGPAPPVQSGNSSGDDEGNAEVEEPTPPQPALPQQPQQPANGFNPGMQPRTPQQILQEMQQRQQQIEQQRNANPQNQ